MGRVERDEDQGGGIQGWRMEAISEQRSDVSGLLCVKDPLDAVQGRGGNGDQLEPGGMCRRETRGADAVEVEKLDSFYLFIYLFIYAFIYVFIYGCVGSSFLCEDFL